MSRKRLLWWLPAWSLVGAQAGHLLVYQLRFGGAAQQLQSAGAHSYFPTVAKTGLGVAALILLAALLVVGAARLIAGRRIEPDTSPPFIRLLAALYTIQLACFAAQETIEAIAGGGHLSSVPALLLWGTAGQLPVAIGAALALRWLGARWRPALAAIAAPVASRSQRLVFATELVAAPQAGDAGILRDSVAYAFRRRGPPSFPALSP